MDELPRFDPKVDPRPKDVVWQGIKWPIDIETKLKGKFVLVEPLQEVHAQELFDALNSDELWEHAVSRPKSAADIAEPLRNRTSDSAWFPWIIRLIENGEIVGTTSFMETSANDARTEIGATTYAKSVWASKVNPETKYLLLSYAFEELCMGRVQLKTDIRNVRSQQAIARLGATYEGILRRYQRRADGSVRDTVLFSITAEEWPKVRARLEERLYSE
jgi:RimJ/RimL family protein N-acetyltransferase